jgi:methylated-DNA-[protein]-cysteine S-methyltransferase
MTVSPELDRRFRDAAAASGELDVAYDLTETPIGELLLATTERGLCSIEFRPDLDELARHFGPRVLRVRGKLDPVRRQLDEYFEQRRESFELTLDLHATGFPRQVLEELAHVPYGTVSTYGALAAKVGRPRAARAVGGVMNRNPIPIVLPCHRIVGSNGSLTGYGGGLHVKEALLRLEGARL